MTQRGEPLFNVITRRVPLTLTALDAAADGDLVDLTALDAAGRNRLHSRRARRAAGVDLICKHCHRPVHLHHGPRCEDSDGFWWFQHNPGQAAGCDLVEVTRGGESHEHLAAKVLGAKVHRRLGWHVEPERRSTNGPLVVADLFAEHPTPAAHQWPRCIEVQLSSSSAGDLAARSAERRNAFGAGTQWLTPDTRTLGDQWGLVVAPDCSMVVDRLYLDPDRGIPLGPMPLVEVISRTVRDRHSMVMAAAGPALEWGGPATWIVYPTTHAAARMARKARPANGVHLNARPARPVEVYDRDRCDRDPLPVPPRATHTGCPYSTGNACTDGRRCPWCLDGPTITADAVRATQPPIYVPPYAITGRIAGPNTKGTNP